MIAEEPEKLGVREAWNIEVSRDQTWQANDRRRAR